jgi:serine/threonine-protein kinase
MGDLLARLKERKVVQWSLAYLAGAWVVLQVMDVVADPLGWPDAVQVAVMILVAAGFFVTVALAWFHGEKGHQRVSVGELALVSAIVVLAVATLSWLDLSPSGESIETPDVEAAADPRPSVAVLPFESRSRLDEDTFFTEGVHGQILGQVSKVRSLRVISRTSVLEFRDSSTSIRDIGAELGADYVMEGSVQRAGDRVLISANLIRASADESVWAGEFEYGLTVDSVFEVQREVARGVAEALSAELLPEDVQDLELRPTENLEAWDAYVAGTLVPLTSDHDRWRTQLDAFLEATRLDPAFGQAWAWLARTYAVGFSNNYWTDVPTARAALRQAEDLAPDAPETAVARAAVIYYLDRDYSRALPEFERALAERPNDDATWILKGALERRMDLWEDARESFLRADAIDPRAAGTKGWLSSANLRLGRIEEAERWAAQQTALSGSVSGAINIAILHRGDTVEARRLVEPSDEPVGVTSLNLSLPYLRRDFEAELDSYLTMVPRSPLQTANRLGWIAELADRTGRDEMARVYADSLLVVAQGMVDELSATDVAGYSFVPSLWLVNLGRAHFHRGDAERSLELSERALEQFRPLEDRQDYRRIEFILSRAYLMAGRHEAALDILERHLAVGDVLQGVLRLDAVYDPVRDHPRFVRLLEEYPLGG